MDRAVAIDMHQRSGLVHRDQGEGDAEHHRRQRDAALDDRARRIQGGDAGAPRTVFARGFQLLDEFGLGLVVLDRLAVRGALATSAQQIGLAHVERVESALPRDRVHHAVDRQHPLRAAKTAEGGVGNRVGLPTARGDRHIRQLVAVAGMEHRPIDDAGGKVRRAAASGVERNVVSGDDALVVVADPPVGPEIVAFAGQHEIVVSVQAHLARTAGFAGGQRGDSGLSAGLALLAAEAAAHPSRLDRDESVGKSEDARDDMLRLGRVLSRGVHRHLVAFAGNGEGDLAFEIEMFLAADREPAFEAMVRPSDGGGRVARPKAQSSWTRAPVFSASSIVTEGTPSSMPIVARRAARRASSRVRATTANNAWPWNRISASANRGSSANEGAMSFLPGMSAALSTATTPAAARTGARSRLFSRPQALSAMPIATCSAPSGSRMSST